MNSTENQENNGQVINMKNSANGDANRDSKGNEDRKIFVGGIAYDVTSEDLTDHFKNFGEVANAQVKFDRNTGRSRGFAFVEFGSAEGCKKALMQREQDIKGKQVEVKPAKSRENKKVFVGGLPADFPEDELRGHFEQYGKVEDIEWPFDKVTKTRRNFAFIVFEEEESADSAAALSRQTFGTRECDVKKAVPQNKRFNATSRGMGGMRTGYTNGMRGGAMIQNAGQWFGNNWGQMNAMPYAGGAWSDWYSNQAYYQQNAAPTAGGYTNGYDYSQPPPTVRQPTANGTPARYSQPF